MTTTIVLGDDHQMVREGLRSLLERESGFSIVGEAADGQEVLTLVERLKPDVLVTDLMMPGLNGLEVTNQTRRRSPGTRIVVLSMHAAEAYVTDALRNGASAYVLKEASASDLVAAVQTVMSGRRYLSPSLSERAIEAYAQHRSEAADIYDTLSLREREVLQLAAEGATNAEIGERLVISPRTVEVHRTNLMRKLGLRTRADLIRYAIGRGILPVSDPTDGARE